MAYDYFKKITRLYFQEKDGQTVNPISEVDADIITEICIALQKIGQAQLHQAILRWKQSSDKDVYEDLLEFNTIKANVFLDDEDDEEGSARYKWLDFHSFSCRVKDLMSIECDEYYDYDEGRMLYTIIFNRCDDGNRLPMHANKTFRFVGHKTRDREFVALKNKLAEYNNVQFI